MRALPVGKQFPRLLIAGLALTAGLGLATPPGLAAAASAQPGHPATAATKSQPAAGHRTTRPGLPPQPASGTVRDDDGAQRLSAADRPPLSAAPTARQQARSKPAAHPTARANATCDPNALTANTGDALVQAVEAAGSDCVNTLFAVTGATAHQAFQESQMTTIANALATAAPSYPGDDSTHLLELVLYLRAGYYVQWNDAADVGSYGATLQNAIQAALDAFYAAPHSQDVTDANGAVLAEAVTLIDSAGQNARYLPVEKRLLAGYNSSYDSAPNMDLAVNNVYTVLFRGHQNADFVAATEADPSILTTLDTFATTNLGLLGGAQGYLESNAGTELARFLQDTTLLPTVRPLVKGLLADSAMTGPTAGLWVGVAAQADQYDNGNCADYGTCDLPNRLKAAVLTNSYPCGTITILSQALTADQQAATCTSLTGETTFFHNVVKDSGPLPGQYESTLQMVVFASPQDYQTYAGEIFGVGTDNGGITVVGNPTDPNNQPFSLTYQNGDDGFTAGIWNLNHEYTHYLDARYDTLGDFTAATSTPDTIWWIEGLAEYDSYTYRGVTDTEAVADAAKATYPLSTIFANTYGSGDDRVYPWGYLSVRYMLENHWSDVNTLLGDYRAGNYQAAYDLLTSIGTSYDADWTAWLAKCAAGACTAPTQGPAAGFTAQVGGLTAAFTDTSTDAGGSITARSWDFGDGTTSTEANPSRTYAAAGSYQVTLTVTDSRGATATTTQTVTVTAPAECTGSDTRALGQDCARSGLAAAADDNTYLYLDVPAGTPSLTITTTPGSGSADLYYSAASWASPTNYTASATGAGPHTLTISNPPAGEVYLTLHATTAFTGASVTTRY
ncbi:collagenase [Kitasatospora sp. LaBMicrA B282]|uniref:collagenase n=1 Tax=Kitasatospora sp. LaBMicrA B282 TaxID=3420949 RepID=UPI003D0D723C